MSLSNLKSKAKSTVQNIGEYKMEILKRCLESDTLTKLLAYDESDALFRNNLSEEKKFSLLYDRVFPYRFVPNPIDNQGTFLTLGASGFRRHEEGYTIYDDYITGSLFFYIFTHVDLMKTDSGVRQDLMLAEIDRLFDGKRGIGMGELKIRFVDELWIHNNKFGGYAVAFSVTDLK